MRLLFAIIGLLGFSLSATAASEWLYYKEYPWVYDNVSKDWLYLRGAANGSIYAYRNSTKEWSEFIASEPILRTSSGQVVVGKFDDQYKYRDLAGITTWTVYETGTGWRIQTGYHDGEGNSYSATGAFDQLPSSGFSQSEYEISDDGVYIWNPNGYALYYEIESVVDGVVTSNYGPYGAASISKSYFFISKDKAEEFYNLKISESTIPVPTWDDQYEEWILNPEPYGGLSVLQQIKEAKDSGATELDLWSNNISDITPLAGLTNLADLQLSYNNISDLSPLAGLTNLTSLLLTDNNITDLTPLAGLTNLTSLLLTDNNITDLTPLAGLTNLTELYLYNNNISDLTPLAGLTNLTELYLYNNNISDLTPLAGLTNLWVLNLIENPINDITPLAGLTNLTELWLIDNNISDLTLLAGLTNLTDLILESNYISDLTPLAGLTNLTVLILSNNNISDLSPLAGLTNLEWLWLYDNNVTDLTPLAGLTNLTELDLYDNPITASQKAMLEVALPNTYIIWPDVIIEDRPWYLNYEEWVQNAEPYGGLSVLQQIKQAKDSGATELNLEYSNISDLSPLVGFDTLTSLNLKGNIISDLTPLQGLTNLISLVLWENNINDLSPLSGLKNLESLDLDDNNISDLSALTGLSNLEQLYLFGNPVLASQKAMLEEALPNTNINWPDWLIEDGFGLTETEFNSYVVGKYFNVSATYNGEYDEASSLMFNSNGTITYFDEFGKVEVDEYENYWEYGYNNGTAEIIITQVDPIDGSLTWIYLLNFSSYHEGSWQSEDAPDEYGTFTVTEDHPSVKTKTSWDEDYEEWILDPEPYGGLSVLQKIKEAKESGATEVDLYRSNIKNISPLAGLTNLQWLYLYDNNISDLSPLAGLTNLTELDLWSNNISDLTPLAGLTNLTGLWIAQNNISDISPLAGLTNLMSLYLYDNNISDISPLAGLTNLMSLYLYDNNISDLSPLAGLTNLTELDLYDNPITASQKAMLEVALPNTNITWPDVIIDDELTRSAKTAKLEIFTDSLDWEAIFKSRNDYVYTNYSVIDDGLSSGDLRVSISAYDPNYPSIQTTSNTSVDIRNYRSDENGDGIYDILDPDIFYQGSFTGTESGTYYNNNSYLGNVVLETLFNATRSPGQTFLRAEIYATVTSSSIPAIQVGQSFSIDRDYYTLSWSGTLDYDSTSYQASFSDNQTKVGYSANSQITQTNESSITLKNFSLPNSLGTTTNTDISLTKKGDIFHKQFVSNGITYYFRVLDIED